MAISFPREMPNVGVITQGFDPRRVDYQSPNVDGMVASVTAGAPLWATSVNFGDTDEEEFAIWRAFIDSLRGAQRPFYCGDLSRPYPKAYIGGFAGMTRAGGGAFVGGASSWTVNADRDTVTLNGLPASFKLGIGDYIMWRWVTGGEQRRALGRAIEDVTGSAGGSLSIAFEIPLPTLVPAGAVADLANPKCIMKQRTEETKVGEIDALHEGRGTFVAVQDLRI